MSIPTLDINKEPLPLALRESDDLTEKSECTHCGQQMYLRPVGISSPIVYALKAIQRINHEQVREATADDMARLGRSVYCTYKQLKYWGLIRLIGEGVTITAEGKDFLAGRLAIEPQLWVYNDVVRERPDLPVSWITVDMLKEYVPPTKRQDVREAMVGLTNQ